MFSVNIKGHRDPNNIEWVKLELIFYKSGYARVPKVLHITGLYKHWDNKVQRFVDKSRESEEKNKLIQREKTELSESCRALGDRRKRLAAGGTLSLL